MLLFDLLAVNSRAVLIVFARGGIAWVSLAEFTSVGRPVPRPRPAGSEALYQSTIERNSEL